MYKYLMLIVPLLMCSCTQHMVNYGNYRNIDNDLKAMGVDESVIEADLKGISENVIAILHQNFSLDDTFLINNDDNSEFMRILVPAMKQSGFKVYQGNTVNQEEGFNITYTFTVTNNQLIETADVALFRFWAGDNFQITKAFTWAIDGLQDKTAYCIMQGDSNG